MKQIEVMMAVARLAEASGVRLGCGYIGGGYKLWRRSNTEHCTPCKANVPDKEGRAGFGHICKSEIGHLAMLSATKMVAWCEAAIAGALLARFPNQPVPNTGDTTPRGATATEARPAEKYLTLHAVVGVPRQVDARSDDDLLLDASKLLDVGWSTHENAGKHGLTVEFLAVARGVTQAVKDAGADVDALAGRDEMEKT